MFTMPTINLVATGRNITRLRELAGLSVKDLAEIFGFATPQAVYKWQHGTALPTIDNLVVLAVVFGVTMDEIVVITHADEKTHGFNRADDSPQIF